MTTPLAKRLERLEQTLGAAEDLVELLGIQLTRKQVRAILRAAQGTTIEPKE